MSPTSTYSPPPPKRSVEARLAWMPKNGSQLIGRRNNGLLLFLKLFCRKLWGSLMSFRFYQKVELERTPDYAFIIHARNIRDLVSNFPELEGVDVEQIRDYCIKSKPQVLGDVTRKNDDQYGVFIGAFFDPGAFLFSDSNNVRLHGKAQKKAEKLKAAKHLIHARKALLEAGNYAGRLGCKYVGLGALTAAFTGYGIKFKSDGYQVTTGHCMTASTIYENLQGIVRKLDDGYITVTVLGAAGSMGRLISVRLIDDAKHKLLLVDKDGKENELNKFYGPHLGKQVQIRSRHDYLHDSDVVISVTNATRTLIDPSNRDLVRPGTILLDDAQPWCWDREPAIKRFKEDGDILPLEAGLLSGNGKPFITRGLDHGLPGNTVFSCLAETYLLTKHPEKLTPTLGMIADEKSNLEFLKSSKQFGEIAKLEGISTAPWRAGHYELDADTVKKFFMKFGPGCNQNCEKIGGLVKHAW
jgi:predicted amino acid dehydrogenase